MLSLKSSILLASLASLSLARPLEENQTGRALRPWKRGSPSAYPSLQCAATGQRGLLDEDICGTAHYCFWVENADQANLKHDKRYETQNACFEDHEPAPEGRAETPKRPAGEKIPWMEWPVRPFPCGAFGLGHPAKNVFGCSTTEYCELVGKSEKESRTTEECLAQFEKRPLCLQNPEDPECQKTATSQRTDKSDSPLEGFKGETDSKPLPVCN